MQVLVHSTPHVLTRTPSFSQRNALRRRRRNPVVLYLGGAILQDMLSGCRGRGERFLIRYGDDDLPPHLDQFFNANIDLLNLSRIE